MPARVPIVLITAMLTPAYLGAISSKFGPRPVRANPVIPTEIATDPTPAGREFPKKPQMRRKNEDTMRPARGRVAEAMQGGDSVSKSAYSKYRGGGNTHKTRVNNDSYYSKRKGGWKHSQKHMTYTYTWKCRLISF